MRITFHGAAQEITGSMHLLEVNGKRILLECGLFQGRRAETYERNLHFSFDPASIDALVLSHAHIDHSGNIPNLVKQGFAGNIWCTTATRNLAAYMLMDSGHIQEQDVEYVNKVRGKKGEPPVEPLYTRQDAQRCLSQFISIGFNRTALVADGVEVTFHRAGHILGAAIVEVNVNEPVSSRQRRIVFSGDLGRSQSMILNPPVALHEADIVIMESTYGDRLHETYDQARKRLRDIVNAAAKRRGKVIVPSFAVGRTQEIVYVLNQLDARGDIPPLPVFVDSPLAVEATDVFRMHPEEWNEDVQRFLIQGERRNPFDYGEIEYVREVRRSKQLNFLNQSAVIISASGMAESGRILHHLKNNIEDPNSTILLVSFQAQETLGRRIKDGVNPVRIFGEEHPVRARVESIEGYSAHADQAELTAWATGFDLDRLERLYLVHGEPGPATSLKAKLGEYGLMDVEIPARNDGFDI
jgi:metallo-beta-lactamase family protein